MTPLEMNDLLSDLSIEYFGCQPVPTAQEDLNGRSTEILKRLRDHQTMHLARNQVVGMEMMLNLHKIESAISLNASVPERGWRTASGSSKRSRERSESAKRSDRESSETESVRPAGPPGLKYEPTENTVSGAAPLRRIESPPGIPAIASSRPAASSTDEMPPVRLEHEPFLDPDCEIHVTPEHTKPGIELLPYERLHPDEVPAGPYSTVLVRNIHHELTEFQIVYTLNSLNGKFDAQCTALSAINIIYVNGPNGSKIRAGKVYAMYASQALAELAVRVLNGAHFRGRRMYAAISKRRCECRDSGRDETLVGQTRYGEDIFNCPIEL